MTMPRPPSRRFPRPGWAWPDSSLDLLLHAALCPDADRAEAALRRWLAAHDIDTADFAQHRLLVAIAARFGRGLSDLPDYPRLAGLQRMLWTKGRMALREAEPPLRQMAGAGIPVMPIKGAARLATDRAAQKSRVSHDIDIVVPQGRFVAALDILRDHDWRASSGASALQLRRRAGETRALNLFFGHFGDIDLHRFAYRLFDPVLEGAVWADASAGMLSDIPVRLPAPEDRIAIALSHSALDAHTHSDWIVDIAHALRDPALDPARLARRFERAGLGFAGEVVFDYLRAGPGLDLPDLPGVTAAGRGTALSRVATLVEMKPRAAWTGPVRALRGVVKQTRILRERRAAAAHRESPAAPRLKALAQRLGRTDRRRAEFAEGAPIRVGEVSGGAYRIDLTVALSLPGVARRVAFELNTADCHLAALTALDPIGRSGWARARFRGRIDVPAGVSGGVILEMRPSRTLRAPNDAEQARYGACRVHVLCASITALDPR
jgi:hypothetical protein